MCNEGLLKLMLEDMTTRQRSRAEGVEEDFGRDLRKNLEYLDPMETQN